LQLFGFLGK